MKRLLDCLLVAMKAQTVRFGTECYRAIEMAARMDGVSASQFIREAAFCRAASVLLRAKDPGFELSDALAGVLRQHPSLMDKLAVAIEQARAG